MEAISFTDVLSLHDSLPGSSSVDYARGILNAANEHAEGKWSYGSLTRNEIEDIVLSYHLSEGGNTPLSPKTGSKLNDAIQFIQQNKSYDQQSPACWKKIKRHSNSKFSPIFLARQPVKNWDDHRCLDIAGNHFHLDGLHRLVGWGLAGKFSEFSPNEQIPGLVFCIAANA